MPTVRFLGQILPDAFKISLCRTPQGIWPIPEINLTVKVILHIEDSVIDVACELNREFRPDDLAPIYMRALDLSRASVNLVAFATGFGPTVHIHTFVQRDGIRTSLAMMDQSLAAHCTACAINSSDAAVNAQFDNLLQIVLSEPPLFMALNDLITSITLPHESSINCARVVEGLRSIIAPPGTPEKQAWEIMRGALQVGRDYLQLITDTSKNPRHGNRAHISGTVTTEITHRTWQIMNRFLEFKKRGNQALLVSEFQVLV